MHGINAIAEYIPSWLAWFSIVAGALGLFASQVIPKLIELDPDPAPEPEPNPPMPEPEPLPPKPGDGEWHIAAIGDALLSKDQQSIAVEVSTICPHGSIGRHLLTAPIMLPEPDNSDSDHDTFPFPDDEDEPEPNPMPKDEATLVAAYEALEEAADEAESEKFKLGVTLIGESLLVRDKPDRSSDPKA